MHITLPLDTMLRADNLVKAMDGYKVEREMPEGFFLKNLYSDLINGGRGLTTRDQGFFSIK